MNPTHETFRRTLWRDDRATSGTRVLAEEAAVAISYNGSTHAVLMATPADLEDLAIGFSLTEGILDDISAIERIDVVAYDRGLDVQVRVTEAIADRLAKRRRSMAGPVGCGMCGLESLEAASRDLPRVDAIAAFSPSDITQATASIERMQLLNRDTGAAHAAGFFTAGEDVERVREDVGRHNALDKLIGHLLRSGVPPSSGGFIVTSRVSVELVQKSVVAGCGLLAAISAPTALAVRAAEAADLTLAAVVRGRHFEIFSHPHRVSQRAVADVA